MTTPSPRELRSGVAPLVLALGPPPVPGLTAPLSARTVEPGGADLDLVHTWMNLPHVAEFFDQAWPRDRWRRCLADQLRGTFSRPLLVFDGADPVAYVKLYRAARDLIAPHYGADPHDIGFHLAIGSPEGIGQGLGGRVFTACAEAVFAADPHCRRLVIEPDAANRPARRAAERAGAVLLCEADLPHKRAAIMALHR